MGADAPPARPRALCHLPSHLPSVNPTFIHHRSHLIINSREREEKREKTTSEKVVDRSLSFLPFSLVTPPPFFPFSFLQVLFLSFPFLFSFSFPFPFPSLMHTAPLFPYRLRAVEPSFHYPAFLFHLFHPARFPLAPPPRVLRLFKSPTSTDAMRFDAFLCLLQILLLVSTSVGVSLYWTACLL